MPNSSGEYAKYYQHNIFSLLVALNSVRYKSDIPMIISSGLRSKKKHTDIYLKKGVALEDIPWGSFHLIGAAADVHDPDHILQKWVLDNEHFVENCGLWIEHFAYTKGYVHFQIYPFRSFEPGNTIFFKPY